MKWKIIFGINSVLFIAALWAYFYFFMGDLKEDKPKGIGDIGKEVAEIQKILNQNQERRIKTSGSYSVVSVGDIGEHGFFGAKTEKTLHGLTGLKRISISELRQKVEALKDK